MRDKVLFYILSVMIVIWINIILLNKYLFLLTLGIGITVGTYLFTKSRIYLFLPLVFVFYNNYLGTEKFLNIPIKYLLLLLSIYLFIIIILINKNNFQLSIKSFNINLLILFIYLFLHSLLITRLPYSSIIYISFNFVLVLFIFLLIKEKKDLSSFLIILVLSAIGQAGIGIWEFAQGKTLYYEQWAGTRYREGIMRIGSTAADPNFLCFSLIPIIPIIFYLKRKNNKFMNLFYNLSLILISCVVFITYSRIGWISIILTYILILSRMFKINKLLKFIFTIFIISMLAFEYLPKLNLSLNDSSFKVRLYTQLLALKLFLYNPLFGIGISKFNLFSGDFLWKYYGINMELPPTTMNTYLQVLVETGLIGMLLFISVIISCLKKLVRNRKVKEEDEISTLKFYLLVSYIIWLLIAITLDGLFTPMFWILSILPFIVQKVSSFSRPLQSNNSNIKNKV
ncbi:O-antigen ligase family protein [Anoxybacillus kestanbolensis]|uniref:O-antigen ligase family protein n=1 Tax=Anoxybacillus kestanbolensis TaxID=227476 RepID=UPI003D193933